MTSSVVSRKKRSTRFIQARTRGRREVLHDPFHFVFLRVTLVAPLDPRLHLGVLVRRVVVDNLMKRELCAFPVEVLQKTEPLFVGVGLVKLPVNGAFQIVERCKECHGPVACAVVGRRANLANPSAPRGRLGWVRSNA